MNTSHNKQPSRRAIFLDRDGTLNEEVSYICDPAQFHLLDVAAEAIHLANQAGWLVIVITNQAGIARGLFTEEFLAGIHQRMTEELAQAGARVDAIYYCPHHPDIGEPPYRQVCDCRKPLPGLLTRAAAEFKLNLSECLAIGDRYRDVAAAQAAGARGVLVLTGYGREEFEQEQSLSPHHKNDIAAHHIVADHVAANVLEAVRWVINES
ncbi:MAG: D-glycero-beta-D-manno-heptose 1,7-bisphosphate 7-phosphatase [Blastocatellia bacterium]